MKDGIGIMFKPLTVKNYGSIPHLPNSRLGTSDSCVNSGQSRIANEKTSDRSRRIIVQEKLDGSNVGVCKLNGVIYALTRAGYVASSSPYKQHQYFSSWVRKHYERFNSVLLEGERVCGEWLLQAHGTRYELIHEPFVVFDMFYSTNERFTYKDLLARLESKFITPKVIHNDMYGFSIDQAINALGSRGFHGALDKVEGAVWRIEKNDKVQFLCKYVRPDKVDGCYIPQLSDTKETIWNVDIEEFRRNLK